MPKIILNPNIENNIKIINYDEYLCGNPDKQEQLMEYYENGYLIVLRNYKFKIGENFFPAINFPNERRSKKIILSTDDNAHMDGDRNKEWKLVNDELLADDPSLQSEFKKNVVAANTEVFRLIDLLFPRYNYKKKLCIYNLTEMFSHNLHFDSPLHADESTQVKMFINLDSFPRIWHLSEAIEKVANNHYKKASLKNTISRSSRRFSRQLTLKVYGDRHHSGSHNFHKHSIAFKPGEVWFVNPNMTAHEVVYGRRLLDAVFMFDKADLLSSERYFPNVVKNIHRENNSRFSLNTHKFINRISDFVSSRYNTKKTTR